jgi:membrane-associated protein
MPDSASALQLVAAYGYPVLALLLFLASAGLPLPVAIVLVALGAVSAQGSALSLPPLILLGALASVAGDLLPYGLGRAGGPRLLGRLRTVHHGILATPLDRAQGQLHRHGAGMIFLSRFAFTAIATPVALLGGVSRLPLRSFLVWDALGEVVFVLSNLAVGRLFGAAIFGSETLTSLLWLAPALVALLPLLLSALRLLGKRRLRAKPQGQRHIRRLPAPPDPLLTPPATHAA